jgi:hypothetical protein
MDVLHFMKEEYSAIREALPQLGQDDVLKPLDGAPLRKFMTRLDLVVRVGGELIIPELVDAGRGAAAVALLAEDQVRSLARILAAFRKSGEIAENKQSDLYRKVFSHVDQMEKSVLPLVRELIPTAVREDIGEIALDYREDVGPLASKPPRRKAESSISA